MLARRLTQTLMLLGDTLKETGRADDALEYLQQGLAENLRAAD